MIESRVADEYPLLFETVGLERRRRRQRLVVTMMLGGERQAGATHGRRQAARQHRLLIEHERLGGQVALQKGARRHVVRDALGQMGYDALAAKVRLLARDAQVALEIARNRAEHHLGRLVRVHGRIDEAHVAGGHGATIGLRLRRVELSALDVRERLLGGSEEASAPLAQAPLVLVLFVEAVVCAIVAADHARVRLIHALALLFRVSAAAVAFVALLAAGHQRHARSGRIYGALFATFAATGLLLLLLLLLQRLNDLLSMHRLKPWIINYRWQEIKK